MFKAWKRARVSIFTMVALILLLVPMSQAGAKDRDAKNFVGKNVVPQHGETEILGRVIDVADNGDLIIRLSETR
ncbi:MAG: hypothetical protein CVU64_13715, partial [Deltaproteobacteria bacterium HGW-Deltaproteobacteria-21]